MGQLTTRIEKRCIVCGEDATVIVSKAKHARWVAGEHAQNVWPDMTPGDREQIISGTHSACFDKLFGPDEDQNDVDDWDFDGCCEDDPECEHSLDCEDEACPDDPDGLHHVGCGCDTKGEW